jgi:hypothetical protein
MGMAPSTATTVTVGGGRDSTSSSELGLSPSDRCSRHVYIARLIQQQNQLNAAAAAAAATATAAFWPSYHLVQVSGAPQTGREGDVVSPAQQQQPTQTLMVCSPGTVPTDPKTAVIPTTEVTADTHTDADDAKEPSFSPQDI